MYIFLIVIKMILLKLYTQGKHSICKKRKKEKGQEHESSVKSMKKDFSIIGGKSKVEGFPPRSNESE